MPDHFSFSVKLPKQITHQRKLIDCSVELDAFMEQATHLQHKLAILLVQLPPKLGFEPAVVNNFFRDLVDRTDARIACEPRHLSWFSREADTVLEQLGVSRVAADPAICGAAARPGRGGQLNYWRLHGSPVTYRSSYEDRLSFYAEQFEGGTAERETWCIFDNTASSAATGDALALMARLARD